MGLDPALRASDQDRDEVLVRLHTAYAEGRLTEVELDERIDLVLSARTHGELDRLATDLPAWPIPEKAAAPRIGGRFQLAYKSSMRRAGRWRVPDQYTAIAYKGGCLLDLRDADMCSLTTIHVIAYKSSIEIIVPPGARVEISGIGISTELREPASPAAPVIHVRGLAYKGHIEAKDHLHRHGRS
ncbi:DUF1707 SHOCT-like domain-containing protein [Actinomadura rudentiformis]|uniref:DUF1707 domain-containing protein n=1 Tax=Actinomadura rudentiformis TaxID=359158 RepID=A0A6H9YH64_9ACTN|nr:DUF1707 domain-containing protein [Actinomadura rudentiformis]KAB2343295.1 DUF1707 domain-containing protein [Actinomadura rudentiformis]